MQLYFSWFVSVVLHLTDWDFPTRKSSKKVILSHTVVVSPEEKSRLPHFSTELKDLIWGCPKTCQGAPEVEVTQMQE